MHGAYEVTRYIAGSDTLLPDQFPVRRLFIHRDSYMIFQNRRDEMTDYKLGYDSDKYEYVLTDYQKHTIPLHIMFNPGDSVLILEYARDGRTYQLTGKALDWKKLPAVQKGFHWTVDGGE